jgi:hypothetical protein
VKYPVDISVGIASVLQNWLRIYVFINVAPIGEWRFFYLVWAPVKFCKKGLSFQKCGCGRSGGSRLLILITREVEIRRISVRGQFGQNQELLCQSVKAARAHPTYYTGSVIRRFGSRNLLEKYLNHRAASVAQAVECLPSKCFSPQFKPPCHQKGGEKSGCAQNVF